MKQINQFITEYIVKKKLEKPIDSEYSYHPKNKEELIDNIKELLGKGQTNLNCIDTSAITDMSVLFSDSDADRIIIKDMNINVSDWDVSNVTNMSEMFNNCCSFDCDLSNWDVSKVEDMEYMFVNCKNFTGKGLENWDVSNVKYMGTMFADCKKFTGNTIENWDVSNVLSMSDMFWHCDELNCNLSKWNVSNVKNMQSMFYECINLQVKDLRIGMLVMFKLCHICFVIVIILIVTYQNGIQKM